MRSAGLERWLLSAPEERERRLWAEDGEDGLLVPGPSPTS